MKAFSLIGECREKSELVRRLVVELTERGLRVSTIKRVSDAVDLERAGIGTWKHRAAGAEEVMIASATRFALLREMPQDTHEPDVGSLLARMAPVDIVLLDGFRRSGYPKVEVVPSGQNQALLAPNDPMVLAVTSVKPVTAPVPRVPLRDIGAWVTSCSRMRCRLRRTGLIARPPTWIDRRRPPSPSYVRFRANPLATRQSAFGQYLPFGCGPHYPRKSRTEPSYGGP